MGINNMPKGIPRDKSINRKIVHLQKIARGHLNKVIQMTENGEYCIDVIHQSLAVQAALRKVDHMIMKNHMETCLSSSIKKGDDKEVIAEVMKVLAKL